MRIIIDQNKCKKSGECMKACPEKAISLKDNKVVVDYKKCDLDGICIAACPHDAISYEE